MLRDRFRASLHARAALATAVAAMADDAGSRRGSAMTSVSRRSSRRRSSASVVLGLLTGRRRSSQLAQIRPELVEATVAGVALRLSANQPVDDGDLDSLPQHDVVQKLCATLDDAFAALGHYADEDRYAPFARLTPTNRGLKRFLERYDRLSPDEWTEPEAQAVEYAARAVAVAARAEARRVQRESGPALLELRRRFREGPLAHLERSVQHARTMASIADGSITSNDDARDRWDDVAARLGAVAARLRMIRCQRQLKAQQTLRDDLAATSKRAALARKRLKPLADAIAKRSNGVVSIPPTKSLWRMATFAGCAEASLDSDDAPYEAPTGEDGGETDEVRRGVLGIRRLRRHRRDTLPSSQAGHSPVDLHAGAAALAASAETGGVRRRAGDARRFGPGSRLPAVLFTRCS